MSEFNFKILRVSLTDNKTLTEHLSPEIMFRFLGGRGLGVKLIYDELKSGVDPLSPDNILIFAVGPLTATSVPTAGRFVVITKSPLTGTIFDSHCGGYFGAQLRKAGYVAIVIHGRSSTPAYLWIDDDKVEIKDATHLWGLDTYETTDRLLDETGPKAQVACIGPAGENGVKLAAIINDKHRAAGRGGVGAVMGSKGLKAVVVKGSKSPSVSDEDSLESAVKRARLLIKKNPVTNKALPVYGTAVLVNLINEFGMLPTHNFQEGTFNDAEGVSGEKILERLLVKTYRCHGCPIGCGRITRVNDIEIGGPEYETVWAFGPQCGINDLETITLANHKCNLYGLDTISVGSTIGCAIELTEKGLMESQLHFGQIEGLLDMIDAIAYKRGLGAELAEGSRSLAEKHGAPELSMHVKGLEIPAYDPRGAQGHALGYATSNRGGCHLRSYMIGPEVMGSPVRLDRDRTEGKPELVILYQNLSAAMDSLVVCRFTNFAWTIDDYADMISAAMGIPIGGDEFLKIGERIWTLERLFNVREGLTAADDRLPKRFFKPLPEGGSRNRVVHLDELLPKYYQLRKWDEKGIPTKALISELEIG